MFKIPNILHTIWFGSMLPLQYQKNLVAMKTHNPDYEVYLYSDASTMTTASCNGMIDFCQRYSITLVDVATLDI